jgi:putative ABC transport system permease protein
VLAGALGVSLLAGLVFGLVPALRQGGRDLRPALSGAGRSVGSRQGERVRSGLVVFEMATATVLLAASTVLVRGFQEVRSAESGFVTENVLTLRVNLPPATYPDGPAMARAAEELADRLGAVRGAEWAHAWGPGRPGLSFNFQTSIPEGMVVDQIGDSPLARRHQLGVGGLEDLGIELVRGRNFDENDRLGSTPVAIISESMAEELWPGEDAIGRQYHNFQPAGAPMPADRNWTVIGVAAQAKHGGRVAPPPGALSTVNDSYFPIAQRPERSFSLLVKFAGAPDAGPVREAIRAYDPNIPITQVATMDENFAQEEGTSRFAAQLMGGFGLSALLLAALGVYGVIAFTVTQRTREIGLRAALGADAGRMLGVVVRRGLTLAGTGVLAGVLVASAAIRGLRAVVPNIPAMDVTALVIASVALVLVAVLACLVPATRATRVSPVVALKGE